MLLEGPDSTVKICFDDRDNRLNKTNKNGPLILKTSIYFIVKAQTSSHRTRRFNDEKNFLNFRRISKKPAFPEWRLSILRPVEIQALWMITMEQK